MGEMENRLKRFVKKYYRNNGEYYVVTVHSIYRTIYAKEQQPAEPEKNTPSPRDPTKNASAEAARGRIPSPSTGSQTETQAEAKTEAEWDTAYINDLPDAAFAYIVPGGEEDEEAYGLPVDKPYILEKTGGREAA